MSESLSKQDLINLLTVEIDGIRAEEKSAGWSFWAILLTTATILWTILSLIENNDFALENVLLLFLCFSLIADSSILIFKSLSSTEAMKSRLRYRLSKDLAGKRSSILLFLSMRGIIIFLLYHFSNFMNEYILYPCYFVYGAVALVALLAIILSFIEFPLPIRSKGSITSHLSLVLFIVIPLLASVDLFNAAQDNSSFNFGIVEYKLSLLIVAAFISLSLLTKARFKSPLLGSLIDIRRDIALSRMNIEDGLRHVDIALTGLKLTDVLQKDLKKMLSITDNYSAELKTYSDKFNSLKAQLPSSVEDMTDEHRLLCDSVFDSCMKHLDAAHAHLGPFASGVKKLSKKMMFLVGKHKELPTEVEAILNQVTDMLAKMEKEIGNIRITLDKFKGDYCAKCTYQGIQTQAQ